VQRVLVDGWTPEEAGAPFDIDGQLVARWVAAYQLHGMAALRGDTTIAGGPRRWIASRLAWIRARLGGATRGRVAQRGRASGAPEAPTRRWR
jgi:hypothetical protein